MILILRVLVILSLCGTVFGLKIYTPSAGLAVVNQDVPVSWSREDDSDPTLVFFLVENLIGGEKIQGRFSNASDSSHETRMSMRFVDTGTFRLWAVNPYVPAVRTDHMLHMGAKGCFAVQIPPKLTPMSEAFNVTRNDLAVGARSVLVEN
ncbi:hypothetical protein C8R47DRAFT_812425 [Mycena vitilis]|nr:hypothetical protein C8R47DRAFT_812425 [Mycena vitilis]